MTQEIIDRDTFLAVLEPLLEEFAGDARGLFSDPRFAGLLQRYGWARCLHWVRLGRISKDREMERRRCGSIFWGRVEERLQDAPPGTRVGDILSDRDLDQLANDCGLVVTAGGETFALRDDSL
jgi:hypothetical protein